jgi:hypothetical protein
MAALAIAVAAMPRTTKVGCCGSMVLSSRCFVGWHDVVRHMLGIWTLRRMSWEHGHDQENIFSQRIGISNYLQFSNIHSLYLAHGLMQYTIHFSYTSQTMPISKRGKVRDEVNHLNAKIQQCFLVLSATQIVSNFEGNCLVPSPVFHSSQQPLPPTTHHPEVSKQQECLLLRSSIPQE